MAMDSFSGCQTSTGWKTKLSWFSSFVNNILWLKTTQDQTPKMINQPFKKTKTENINCKLQCFGKSMKNQWDTFKFIGGHGCSCAFMGAHRCSCLFDVFFVSIHPFIEINIGFKRRSLSDCSTLDWIVFVFFLQYIYIKVGEPQVLGKPWVWKTLCEITLMMGSNNLINQNMSRSIKCLVLGDDWMYLKFPLV